MKKKRSLWLLLALFGFFFSQSGISFAQQATSSWTLPADITQQPASVWRGFPVAICDPYQNLHLFWADIKDTGSAIFYRNDVGGNWSIPNDVLLSDPNVYFLAVDLSPIDNTFHMTWSNRQGAATLYYSRASLANAGHLKAWTTPKAIADNVFNSAIKVDPAGIIHLVYPVSDGQRTNFDVVHISSADGGETWSDPTIVYTTNYSQPIYIRAEMAIDKSGRIFVGITQRTEEYGVYSEVGYTRSVDGGQTWGPYQKIADQSTATAWQGVEWIAPYAFGKDEVHLTWHDPRRMEMHSMDGGNTWSTPAEIMQLGAAFGGADQLAKDSAGNLYAVTAWSDGVFVTPWTNAGWGQPEQVDNRPIDPHGQTIVSCEGDQLSVFYYDRSGDTTIWYSDKLVNAPHLSRHPLPEAAPIATTQPITQSAQLSTVESITTPTANAIQGISKIPPGSLPSPMSALLWAIIPVLAFIFAVFIAKTLPVRSR